MGKVFEMLHSLRTSKTLLHFDASKVIDNATYRGPYQESSGMVHVLVGGDFVIRDGALLEVFIEASEYSRANEVSHAKAFPEIEPVL
jgi:hypothetical protein